VLEELPARRDGGMPVERADPKRLKGRRSDVVVAIAALASIAARATSAPAARAALAFSRRRRRRGRGGARGRAWRARGERRRAEAVEHRHDLALEVEQRRDAVRREERADVSHDRPLDVREERDRRHGGFDDGRHDRADARGAVGEMGVALRVGIVVEGGGGVPCEWEWEELLERGDAVVAADRARHRVDARVLAGGDE
jgi:hypothetical protein